MKNFLLFFLLYSSFSFSRIVDFQVINGKKHFFSFKKICSSIGEPDFSSLATVISSHKLRCQKKIVLASSYCLKQMKDNPRFTRGVVDKKLNKGYCEEADRIFLKYSCKGKENSSLCRDKNFTCEYLQSEFARHHKIVRSSRVKNIHIEESYVTCDFIRGDWKAAQ